MSVDFISVLQRGVFIFTSDVFWKFKDRIADTLIATDETEMCQDMFLRHVS